MIRVTVDVEFHVKASMQLKLSEEASVASIKEFSGNRVVEVVRRALEIASRESEPSYGDGKIGVDLSIVENVKVNGVTIA